MSPRYLREAFEIFRAVGLADWANFPIQNSLRPAREFTRQAFSGVSAYPDIYLSALQSVSYNFSLMDMALFQFSWSHDHGILKLRFAFWPFPYEHPEAVSFEDLRDSDELDLFMEDARESFRYSPIRYEYDEPSRLEHLHPASHFHIGFRSTGRVSANNVITPQAFSLAILRWIYGDIWLAHQSQSNADPCLETLWGRHCRRLNPVDTELMSDEERSRLNLSVDRR